MRISDWSSDVCSSDLRERYATVISMLCEMFAGLPRKIIEALDEINGIDGSEVKRDWGAPLQKAVVKRVAEEVVRSEEHTSELQSLMRISYAVFCLKQQKYNTKTKPSINSSRYYTHEPNTHQ